YRGGYWDACFVVYMALTLTLIRAFVMRYLLEPLARRLGVRTAGKVERFKEQGYVFLYYTVSWLSGMYLMYHSPHWFDTKYFWINYPHRDYTWHFKMYYLTSLAYTLHLIYVIHVEARRKDYVAMFTHHIVTAILLATSYVTNFTRFGNAVLCMMDLADILLALAKCLRYARFQKACDTMFGLFMLAWIYTRFYLYAHVCYAAYAEGVMYLSPIWDPPRGLFLTLNTPYFFLTLFGALQILIIYWFALICRVAVRVITGTGAHDNRSSSEDDD
ncbi:TLC domain-containing protein, partial [Thamnocephalis sphaerospora]